ncbi:MAG: hypothetical protein ACI9LU_000956, partial [Polaribacter sp.]
MITYLSSDYSWHKFHISIRSDLVVQTYTPQ